jgi:ATP-binding protein involved in chromosome partitioning
MHIDDGKANMEYEQRQIRIKGNMKRIRRIIAVMSGKGGVGKTTVAINIASGLASLGHRTGILDVDIHGPNVPLMLGLEGSVPTMIEEGMFPVETLNGLKVFSMSFLLNDPTSPVIWRGPMKAVAINQFLGEVIWEDLDFLVVDLPPGTGDEILTIAQQIPGAEAVIVTTPQEVSLLDSRKAVVFAKKLNMKVLGIVENMSGFICPHCGKGVDLFKMGGGEFAAKELSVPFLGRIPFIIDIMESGDDGDPFILGDDPRKIAFNDIIEKILKV